jgi:Amidohydrolase
MARLTQRQRIFVDGLFCGSSRLGRRAEPATAITDTLTAVVGCRLAHNEKAQAAIREEPPAYLDQAVQLAARNPNTRLVIDHLGLPRPHEPSPPAEPFAELPKLLALAIHNNVAVEIRGTCTLSHRALYKAMGPILSHLRHL